MRPIITIFESIHAGGIDVLNEFADVRMAYGVDRLECLRLTAISDAIIVKSVIRVDKELLDSSPKLRLIGRAGTGIDNIDKTDAENRGIKVFTVPKGNSVSAAEFTILQILSLCRRVSEVNRFVNDNDFRRHLLEGRELQNMSIGIVGLGNVGTLITKRLKAFGCKIIGYDPYQKNNEEFVSQGGVYAESFNELLSQVDILTFHARLTSKSYHMMGYEQFNKVKKGLMIINCARAELIDQEALLVSLDNGVISSASLDVLEPEPPFDLKPEEHSYQHDLLNHPKVIFTPHIGASTIEAQKNISIDLAKQIKFFLTSKYDEIEKNKQ
jgi:D-3-phosphoglycerate dehydrogenase / 2-oxoglutarate reductase